LPLGQGPFHRLQRTPRRGQQVLTRSPQLGQELGQRWGAWQDGLTRRAPGRHAGAPASAQAKPEPRPLTPAHRPAPSRPEPMHRLPRAAPAGRLESAFAPGASTRPDHRGCR
jgi:hypothetical protein